MSAKRSVVLFVVSLYALLPLYGQSGRQFSVPLNDLKTWADMPTATLQVRVSGYSSVHAVQNDCEIHLGGKVDSYAGDPDGWVLEPMNACLEPLPGNAIYSKSAWLALGNQVTNTSVTAEGLVRIWPEHLFSSGASNPAHALELHPLLRLIAGGKLYDFSKLVYAPDGFPGGLRAETAQNILTDTTVRVTESAGTVTIDFESGTIGNFATLTVRVLCNTIKEVTNGLRMDGEVIWGHDQKVAVRLVTVAGSQINDTFAQLKKQGKITATGDFLVLFSLDPVALYNSAKQSHGRAVKVEKPLQLIVYGEATSE